MKSFIEICPVVSAHGSTQTHTQTHRQTHRHTDTQPRYFRTPTITIQYEKHPSWVMNLIHISQSEFVCVSVCVSVCLCVCLSVCLFVCPSSLQHFQSRAFKSSQNHVRTHTLYIIGKRLTSAMTMTMTKTHTKTNTKTKTKTKTKTETKTKTNTRAWTTTIPQKKESEAQRPAIHRSSWCMKSWEVPQTQRWTLWRGPTWRWGWRLRWPRRRRAWRSWRCRKWWSAGSWGWRWSGWFQVVAWFIFEVSHEINKTKSNCLENTSTNTNLPNTTVTSTSLLAPRAMLVFLIKFWLGVRAASFIVAQPDDLWCWY